MARPTRLPGVDDDCEESRGYGQYCPVSRAVEVLGERWTLLILREMLVGASRFNDIARANPGLSRTLLSKRLRQLERHGLVDHIGDQYRLTPAGQDLRAVVFGLGEWSARWLFRDPRDSELDPELLMWWVHTRLDFSEFPDRRMVLAFRFRDHPSRFWILRDAQGVSICQHDPGFGIDASIEGDLSTMYQVWLGRVALRTAVRDGRLELQGAPAVVRRLPAVLALSPIAAVVASVQ